MKKLSTQGGTPAADKFIDGIHALGNSERGEPSPYDGTNMDPENVWGPAGQLEGRADLPVPYGEPKQAMLGLVGRTMLAAGKGALRGGAAVGKAAVRGTAAASRSAVNAGKAHNSFLRNGGVRGALGKAPMEVKKLDTATDVGMTAGMAGYDAKKVL